MPPAKHCGFSVTSDTMNGNANYSQRPSAQKTFPHEMQILFFNILQPKAARFSHCHCLSRQKAEKIHYWASTCHNTTRSRFHPVTRPTKVGLGFGVRATKCQKFVWHYPVEVPIFYFLQNMNNRALASRTQEQLKLTATDSRHASILLLGQSPAQLLFPNASLSILAGQWGPFMSSFTALHSLTVERISIQQPVYNSSTKRTNKLK